MIGYIVFGSLFIISTLISKYLNYNELATWYLLHSVANFFITFLCIDPMMNVLYDPVYHMKNYTNINYIIHYVAIMHVIHMLMYNCTWDDKFHHIIFVGFGLLITSIFHTGYFLSVCCMFVCGIPGAIDYMVLFLYQLKYISKKTRLTYASYINVWLRSPGLCFAGSLAILDFCYIEKSLYNIFRLCCFMFLTFGNGQYYMSSVVSANARYIT